MQTPPHNVTSDRKLQSHLPIGFTESLGFITKNIEFQLPKENEKNLSNGSLKPISTYSITLSFADENTKNKRRWDNLSLDTLATQISSRDVLVATYIEYKNTHSLDLSSSQITKQQIYATLQDPKFKPLKDLFNLTFENPSPPNFHTILSLLKEETLIQRLQHTASLNLNIVKAAFSQHNINYESISTAIQTALLKLISPPQIPPSINLLILYSNLQPTISSLQIQLKDYIFQAPITTYTSYDPSSFIEQHFINPILLDILSHLYPPNSSSQK